MQLSGPHTGNNMSTDSRTNPAPLEGKYVGVACSPMKFGPLMEALREMGAQVDPLDVIAIRELEDNSALDAALVNLDSYTWTIFTSSYAAVFFSRRVFARGLEKELLKLRNVCAVGPGTADTLRKHGIEVTLIPEEFVAEGVLRALADRHGGLTGLAGAGILLPRAKEARDVLPRELRTAGARVDVVPCYETVEGRIHTEVLKRMRTHDPDLLIFTSSSTVRNFLSILGPEEGKRLICGAVVAALGPVTAGTVESSCKKAEIQPRENTIPSLLEAVREFYR
ncbi:MAG TPA: uroporphyrinogen-III synthase [Acidobacteriota bacterium]|nr:uroporphyrinogen-III synthase [Acidobacteriota bacterium]